MKNILSLFLSIIIIAGLSSCGNSDFKKDVKSHADLMCKMIEVRDKLGKTDPADSLNLEKLQAQFHELQIEFTIMNKEFQEKYKDKVKDQDFNKKYMRELSQTMLDDCPNLSKENREMFEKSLKE